MKRLLFTLAAATLLMSSIGCQHPYLARHGCGDSHCNHCGSAAGAGILGKPHGGGHFAGAGLRGGGGPDRVPPLPHGYQNQMGPAGPAGPQVAYPYYTVRGPRDFLMNEPNPLGR